jgi:L-alanine-DL-glutamate epimerase-like enolase superfamily enzyme
MLRSAHENRKDRIAPRGRGPANFDFLKVTTSIREIDPDTVPWYDDLVTVKPVIADGHLLLPTGPGWGTEVNEDAVRAHPPRKR